MAFFDMALKSQDAMLEISTYLPLKDCNAKPGIEDAPIETLLLSYH